MFDEITILCKFSYGKKKVSNCEESFVSKKLVASGLIESLNGNVNSFLKVTTFVEDSFFKIIFILLLLSLISFIALLKLF
jgi:hypothetical protein